MACAVDGKLNYHGLGSALQSTNDGVGGKGGHLRHAGYATHMPCRRCSKYQRFGIQNIKRRCLQGV
jgi:hypothetical protein